MPLFARGTSFAFPALIPSFTAVLVMLGGLGGLFSGFGDFSHDKGMLSELVLMKGNVALGMTMLGCALYLQRKAAHGPLARMQSMLATGARLLAVLTALLGIAILLQAVFGMPLDIDRFLNRQLGGQVLQTGPALPLTGLCFILAGASLALLDFRNADGHSPAEYGMLTVAVIMGIPLINYWYGAMKTMQLEPLLVAATQTPAMFFLLSLGTLFARPGHRLMAVVMSNAPGGYMLRSLLPKTLGLLFVLNLLADWGARHEFFNRDMVSPLVILADSGVLLVLFWRTAAMLNRENDVRRQGEAALAESNALLRIVSDSTGDSIYVKDLEGRFVFANPAVSSILGQRTVLIGHRTREFLINSTDADAIDANDQAVIRSGKAHSFEEAIQVSSGLRRTFYSTKTPWVNEAGQVQGLIGISVDITERKRMEDALKAHEIQLETLVAERTVEVSELIGHLESSREEEKRAIARELHDSLGSALTALSMHLTILFQFMPVNPNLTERVMQVKALLNSVTETTRRIQNGLRPDLDIFGIKTAIAEQAIDFEQYAGIMCRISLPDEEIRYSPQLEINIFRMVQEALNNIAKHAKASQADIIIDDTDDEVILTVRDNGIGIAPSQISGNATHGLRGMRERASYLGGTIKISGSQGGGTKITIQLPKKTPEGQDRQNMPASMPESGRMDDE